MNSDKVVWIAWEKQRRSIELSKELDCCLFIYERVYEIKILHYFIASLKTISFIINKKPKIVFCQNPSLILASLLCFSKKLFKYKLIVDRHSNFMFEVKVNKLFNILSKYTIKNANLTIVTNNYIKEEYIDNIGGKGFVLPDKIPNMNIDFEAEMKGEKNIFFITSFSRDEPILEFFDAISTLPSEYYFFISGNFEKFKKNIDKIGRNYELTGFVTENKFKAILNSVDAVMVFTKHEYTLTCGAYEGVSAKKPLILSNTNTIKEYFNSGAIYCDMSADSIMSGILECFDRYQCLEEEVSLLRSELINRWNDKFLELKQAVFG